ncbi:MAG: hypothetical protein J7M25_13955 [Deltaproteobacteria bacterium]|nr:hypothetical protein [Deltaproteobacteria bacterium]
MKQMALKSILEKAVTSLTELLEQDQSAQTFPNLLDATETVVSTPRRRSLSFRRSLDAGCYKATWTCGSSNRRRGGYPVLVGKG